MVWRMYKLFCPLTPCRVLRTVRSKRRNCRPQPTAIRTAASRARCGTAADTDTARWGRPTSATLTAYRPPTWTFESSLNNCQSGRLAQWEADCEHRLKLFSVQDCWKLCCCLVLMPLMMRVVFVH